MPVRSSGLALLAVAGIAIGLTACSSATGAGGTAASATSAASAAASAAGGASLAATATAPALPAGYHRVGGSAQGISLDVPTSWVSINLAKQSLDQAARELQVPGFDASAVEQDMQSLQKDHAIFVFDIASSASDPHHFTRNLNAYCVSSGLTDTGSAGIPFLQEAAKSEFSTVATDITQTDITIGGVPGIETSYKLDSGTGMDVRGAQLEVLPKPDRACFVSLSHSGAQSAGSYLAVAAATAQFP